MVLCNGISEVICSAKPSRDPFFKTSLIIAAGNNEHGKSIFWGKMFLTSHSVYILRSKGNSGIPRWVCIEWFRFVPETGQGCCFHALFMSLPEVYALLMNISSIRSKKALLKIFVLYIFHKCLLTTRFTPDDKGLGSTFNTNYFFSISCVLVGERPIWGFHFARLSISISSSDPNSIWSFCTYKGGSYPCLGFGVPFAECLQCEKFMFKNKGVLVSRFCQGILFFSLFDIQVPICWPRVPKMLLLLPNHKHQHHPLHRSVKLLALYHFCLTKGNTDGDFQPMSAWSFLKAILQMMALTFCLCVSEFRKGFSSVS